MTRFVIDPPVLLAIARAGVPVHPHHQLVAPHAVRTSALELLLGEVRAGSLGEAEALSLHEVMTAVKIRTLGDRGSRGTAWKLARKHGWDSFGDAEYLAIGVRQADALVAFDPELVAKADGIVPLTPISALFSA
jgi:predicted nucleic acid-binding protein